MKKFFKLDWLLLIQVVRNADHSLKENPPKMIKFHPFRTKRTSHSQGLNLDTKNRLVVEIIPEEQNTFPPPSLLKCSTETQWTYKFQNGIEKKATPSFSLLSLAYYNTSIISWRSACLPFEKGS